MTTEKRSEMFFADACVCSVMRVLQLSVCHHGMFLDVGELDLSDVVVLRYCSSTWLCYDVLRGHSGTQQRRCECHQAQTLHNVARQRCITFKAEDNECQKSSMMQHCIP